MESEGNNLKLEHKGWYTRGYLPHYDSSNVIQVITYRLVDSLPKKVVDEIELELRINPSNKNIKLDRFLDKGYGECYLRQPQIAEIVEAGFKYFHESRYRLIAWVVMPNHVHVIVEPYGNFQIGTIVHSWKSYTANVCNKVIGKKGAFWFPDFWDRYIRNTDHFYGAIEYIHLNPVKAGLAKNPEDWLFSSARFYAKNHDSDGILKFT